MIPAIRMLAFAGSEISADIVGTGYSGLSATLTLARAGRDVTVIDGDIIGYGCSSRNGG